MEVVLELTVRGQTGAAGGSRTRLIYHLARNITSDECDLHQVDEVIRRAPADVFGIVTWEVLKLAKFAYIVRSRTLPSSLQRVRAVLYEPLVVIQALVSFAPRSPSP